jgi:RNA polymerase sigma factor (sigma-70 family)
MNDVIRHFRRAALLHEAAGLTDGQLLECFLLRRDEAAFAALVRRHGPMVLGVCRRVLGNHHDAEDAFQATFLVLARKATSVRSREVVGHWLYGVAYRPALKAKAMTARRRANAQRMKDVTRPEGPADDAWQDLLPLLDRELDRLPERYRVAVILCDLQGMTRREAARRLNLPEGTLSGRLTRARRLLAKRLARYGPAVSGGALAAVLSEKAASACVTGALAASTARAAVLAAAGQALTAGAVPARVVALTEGVVKTMFLAKLRGVVAVGLVLFVGAGVVGLAYHTGAAEPKQQAAPNAARPADDELEALRLEIEALRKGLRATRERVKTLEGEVQALKAKDAAAPQQQGAGGNSVGRVQLDLAPYMVEHINLSDGLRTLLLAEVGVNDPLAEAEAALKNLRQDPNDKQATDALERALQRLKEGAQPKAVPRKGPGN